MLAVPAETEQIGHHQLGPGASARLADHAVRRLEARLQIGAVQRVPGDAIADGLIQERPASELTLVGG